MKNIFILCSALCLCACASVNKNTVSYQMSKYDPHMYYVISGEGNTKEAAGQNAMLRMRRNIEDNVVDVNNISQVKDLLANAKVEKVWRDKSQKDPVNYFALAVLKRETAQNILQAPANEIDARLGALAARLQATEDKFAGLRSAFAMEPLIKKRNVLQDLYVFVSENHQGYETERFDTYKKLYNDRLAAVKVAVSVSGEKSMILLSRITDAINQMGLSAVEPGNEDAQLSVEAEAQVDGYESERLKGLEWVSASAAVSLRDLQERATFARFNVQDRVGTGRQADSLRKSMEGVGGKAADEIVERLTSYLKTK